MTGASAFGWEVLGTALLILFGNGVCLANSLRSSASRESGWLLIAFGWGFAVFIGASVADPSGGHLNPAVTLMLAINGGVSWSLVPFYIAGQLVGAIIGAVLAYLTFKQSIDDHGDGNLGGNFFTIPAHPGNAWNAVTEFIATSALLLFIALGPSGGELGPMTYFGVAIIVVAIGMSLGSPTGYAINPARDLGPRLAYAFLLPIKGKSSAQFAYAWVPIVAPLAAAVFVGLLASVLT
ncbi:MIP/aquaporin family protein [Corynebacterium tapiri]|uniref:Aquaporin family protein n=1 Tax=Corynebacterium tapiri TaxID=1448266 RepID=A0A5C4U8T0_9CORY|nr:MIP/aquaporin family protein [Corynebacterium tapiri]TNM00577.1 aquaporin family protein [Corynebacterium tapiri]